MCSDEIHPHEHCTDSNQPKHPEALSEGCHERNNELFPIGDYTYSFEYLIHDSLPETTSTILLSTRYYLEAVVEPLGLLRSKVVSQLDVPLIRLPSESSLELTEPIIISNKWQELLKYEVCIFGRSFCVGSRIPMTVVLTPIVSIECRWVKVYMTQHIQYWTMGHEPRHSQLAPRKSLLFEKHAEVANYSTYPGSKIRIVTGQGIIRNHGKPTVNLLGQVSETSEIDLEVQLPRCSEIGVKDGISWLQPSTKMSNLEVRHWIQVSRHVSPI